MKTPTEKHAPTNPQTEIAATRLLVFSTGGTIAMRAAADGVKPQSAQTASMAQAADVEPTEPARPATGNPGELAAASGLAATPFSLPSAAAPALPQLAEVAFSNLPSPHLSVENWLALAAALNRALAPAPVPGAVVLHGTDLLPECALTLQLCLDTDKPVVISGSMRAQGEAGYDGLRNLENSVRLCAALPRGREALVCLGDEIFSAAQVFKQHSTALAPMSAPDGPLGRFVGNTPDFYRPPRPAPAPLFNPQALLARGLPPVGLLCPQPGDDGRLVDFLLQTGVKGLVVEGFGAGNLPPLPARKLKAALAAGVPVLLTTRCPQGGAHPIYAYEGGAKDLADAGAVLCPHSTASKALVFLRLALAADWPQSRIKAFFHPADCL